MSFKGCPTVGIIRIIKEKIIAEIINFTNKEIFLCIRHRINNCFAILSMLKAGNPDIIRQKKNLFGVSHWRIQSNIAGMIFMVYYIL